MKRTRDVLWGLVFIILGLIIGLNTLEIIKINIFFDGWWTLIIIVPCSIELFSDKRKIGNIIGILIGIILLLCFQKIIPFNIVFKLVLPITLIIIGLSFIFKDPISKKIKNENKDVK